MATLGGDRFGGRAFTVGTAVALTLVLSAGLAGEAAAGTSFADVQEGGVHRPAIDALEGAGVLDGTECAPDSFCPADPIPRWVVAVWLVRVLDDGGLPGAGGSSFADVDGADWWAPYVERLADLEVTKGCAADPLRFCPDDRSRGHRWPRSSSVPSTWHPVRQRGLRTFRRVVPMPGASMPWRPPGSPPGAPRIRCGSAPAIR